MTNLPNEMNRERANVLRSKIRELNMHRTLAESQVRVYSDRIDLLAGELADIERGNALSRIEQWTQEDKENWDRATL